MKTVKYFLYARKSSEAEERQVKSIEDQLDVLKEYAERSGIKITKTFIESRSAKTPGREVFNQMMMKVYESKDPVGIIAWHPDRLARNSVDGGQIIYLVDIGKIVSLYFPTFWFEPTPQGKFMLQIAFGQSKYYSDNLSENVKRGNLQKVKRGSWLSKPPFGYITNYQTKNIEPNPLKAKIVQKVYEEFVKGTHSFTSMSLFLFDLGVTTKYGTPLAPMTVCGLLTNTAYIGLIKHKGETYEGTFEPIISQHLFDLVQQELKKRSRPRKGKHIRHNFTFTNVFTCGECGGAITAQLTRGQAGGLFRYYRCTKKKGKCSQRYLRDDRMLAAVKQALSQLKLSDEWCASALDKAAKAERASTKENRTLIFEAENKLANTEVKINRLVDAYLDQSITKEDYLEQKESLIKQKLALQKKKQLLEANKVNHSKALQEFIDTCKKAQVLIQTDDVHEIKGLFCRLTNQRILKNQKIYWQWIPPFDKFEMHQLVWE